eukprot:3093680-Rhodomonas_salina.1
MTLMLAAPGTELRSTNMVTSMNTNVLVLGTLKLGTTASNANFKHWNITAKMAVKFNKKPKGLTELLVCLIGVGVSMSM